MRRLMTDIAFDILGSVAIGVGICCFNEPANIAPGGVSGVAILLRRLFDTPVGAVTLALNLPILALAWRRLGKGMLRKTLRTLLISSVTIDWVIAPLFPVFSGDRMLGAIFGGVFAGAGLGLIFSRGSTTAGTDVIGYMIERRFPHIPLGTALMAVDCLVLAASVLVFRELESAMFGLIALFCQTRLVDAFVYGRDRSKQVLIVSEASENIAARIILELSRTATALRARGAFRGRDGTALLCVVRAPEYFALRRLVHEEDEHAFVIVTDAERVLGEGFAPIVENH